MASSFPFPFPCRRVPRGLVIACLLLVGALGRIAAGSPVEAIAGEDTLSFSDFAGDPDTYALKVRGESMIEDHICDRDFVLVQKADQARHPQLEIGNRHPNFFTG